MKIGIFGGSFNPIHLGHLLLAETARDAFSLDRVLFIPAGQPPHKPARGLLPGTIRVRMIQLAIRDHPAFAVSDAELQRSGPSYTIDTLKLLRTRLPEAELFLLIGQDMLTVRWFAWSQVKRLCTVVAVRRPGTRVAKAQRGVTWLAMPQVSIASSDIRARVREGRSIRYLVPAAVARYIRQHELYARGSIQ